jgi:hypothetical protein
MLEAGSSRFFHDRHRAGRAKIHSISELLRASMTPKAGAGFRNVTAGESGGRIRRHLFFGNIRKPKQR